MSTSQSPVHIIYTPGTVELLLPFLQSLLDASACNYVLVDNACLASETKRLKAVAHRQDRVSYLELPFRKLEKHGVVADYLLANAKTLELRFMDSDIFASAPFEDELLAELEQGHAVFSARPLWCTADDEVLRGDSMLGGHYAVTERGQVIGTTHLAWYHADKLRHALTLTELNLQRGKWESLSESQRSKMSQIGFEKTMYDTAKLANLSMVAAGHDLRFRHLPQLHHIGSVSIFNSRQFKPAGERWFRRTVRKLPPGVLKSAVKSVGRAIYKVEFNENRFDELSEEQRKRRKEHARKRNQLRKFFSRTLANLNSGQPMPNPPILGIPEIDDATAAATQVLSDQYLEWRRRLFP